MTHDEKIAQLAKLMNELHVHVWQGVVYIGESNKTSGISIGLNADLEWVRTNK